MKYIIEVDEVSDELLIANAKKSGMTVPALITDLVGRYLIDAHIMEQSDMWENGIKECAEINLDWANL